MQLSADYGYRALLTCACVLAVAPIACSRSDETSAAQTTTAASAAVVASAVPAPTAASGGAVSTCPEGKWKYDYTDRFLENLANASRSRVVSERGEFICTITGRERGSYLCTTSEGGVENVVEATTAAGPMIVTVRFNGRYKGDFEPAGPNRWRTANADLHGLDMQTTATIAGRQLPIPAFNLLPGLDRAGTVLEYQCEGETLKLKPLVEGAPPGWLIMKRVR